MHCPKCGNFMRAVAYQGITVDRCSKCNGLWFDKNELEQLEELKGSEVIDLGPSELAAELDKKLMVKCPRCDAPMERKHVPKQQHIVYDECIKGHGVYFDAGEFRDLKQFTVGEFFKSLFTRKTP